MNRGTRALDDDDETPACGREFMLGFAVWSGAFLGFAEDFLVRVILFLIQFWSILGRFFGGFLGYFYRYYLFRYDFFRYIFVLNIVHLGR